MHDELVNGLEAGRRLRSRDTIPGHIFDCVESRRLSFPACQPAGLPSPGLNGPCLSVLTCTRRCYHIRRQQGKAGNSIQCLTMLTFDLRHGPISAKGAGWGAAYPRSRVDHGIPSSASPCLGSTLSSPSFQLPEARDDNAKLSSRPTSLESLSHTKHSQRIARRCVPRRTFIPRLLPSLSVTPRCPL